MKNSALFALFLATSLGVHAQSMTAANPYHVPMFAGHVESSQCDACGSIVVGSETGFASPDWTPSASDEGSQTGVGDSVAAQPVCDECNTVADGPVADGPSSFYRRLIEMSGNEINPVTQPKLDFSDSRHAVQISGVVTTNGKPVPDATVMVEVDLDGGFVNFQAKVQVLIIADKQGFYATAVRAPAAITAVQVTSPSFCSVKNDCVYWYESSDGAGAIAQ
ncbi:hypothetical protein ACFCQI_02785 [Rhodanobacter sp. FW102-FHT14D06]|uniref:Uncharacterized protein n=2 Tax=unclassified Rhodanobacter TaxID=2621553 RepID=A0AB74UW73_9GAMM